MQKFSAVLVGMIGATAAMAAAPLHAQTMDDLVAQLKVMRAELAQQRSRVDQLERQLRADKAASSARQEDATAAHAASAPAAALTLAPSPSPSPSPAPSPAPGLALAPSLAPAPVSAPGFAPALTPANVPSLPRQTLFDAGGGMLVGTASAGALGDLRGAGTAGAPASGDAVGRAPQTDGRPPEVAPIFEQPGVLTPRGKYVIEPAIQFGYSSSNRIALVGYTIIPALLIGLIDVREVKRNSTTASITVRRGITNRLELEIKVPYVYRSDATVSRELFTGSAVERVFETSGKALGDVEIAGRYQINDGGIEMPYFVGGLRFKTRTGRDPFDVVTDCNTRCVGTNVTGTGLPLDLPTGSGFYSLQPSITWLMPSDPAVFFGSFSYLHNIKRDNVARTVLSGEKESLGEIKPGDVIGFNFGMGLALNDKASLSLGYDHSTIARTYQAGQPVPGSVRTQLGTLLLGFSYRISQKRTLSVSVGAGLTRDTPDVSLMVRMPLTF
ncbi:MAG: acetate kinase [Pseudomonadota bacterium]|nr:acetate kinase [Pseudomonadota bacterium]